MTEKSNQGRKSALLIGIDQYNSEGLNDLQGCLSDVATTEGFLTVAGISDITKITSPPDPSNGLLPTFDNIKSEFETLARNAQPGDFIYIHYSGHGTRLDAAFRDLKGENVSLDECLVLYHGDGQLDHLRDVEVAFLLKQIADKGAKITFVLDCCHSGGATRGVGVRGSKIEKKYFYDLNRSPIQSAKNLRDSWDLPRNASENGSRSGKVAGHWMTASKGINFLAACETLQKAQEVPDEANVWHGLLTDCLARVIIAQREVSHQLSCDAVFNLVAYTLKNHPGRDTWERQNVVFGGQADCLFFGIKTVVQPDVVVTSVKEVVGGGRLRATLTAGLAHGVRERDIFAIYPKDRKLDNLTDYTAPLATCMVVAVQDFTCEAHIQPRAADVEPNIEEFQNEYKAASLRTILKDHVLRPTGVWISAADNSNKSVVQRVQDCISRGGRLLELTDAGKASFEVRVKNDDNFTILFTPNRDKATVEVRGKPEDVISRLVHLAIFYNLYNLAKYNPTQRGLTVSKIGYLNPLPDDELPAPYGFKLDEAPPQRMDLRPVPKDSIDIPTEHILVIEVRNTSYQSVYVEILDLEPSWRVTRIYPDSSDAPIQTEHNGATRFFIRVGPSQTVRDVVQPDTFDRFVVLATSRSGVNFDGEHDVLPILGQRRGPASGDGVLRPIDGDSGRAGYGAAQPGWFVQQLDVRVIDAK